MTVIVAFIFAALILVGFIFFAQFASAYSRALREGQAKDSSSALRENEQDAAGVRDLVAQGRHDEAVEIYRNFTGVDLYTAKERIADMAREHRLGIKLGDIEQRLRHGDKAGAIEIYQAATGADLAEALQEIEHMQQRRKRR